MQLHKLLKKQLQRLNITPESPPTDIERWQQVIERINNAYIEADQERYLLERAMDISSRELLDLNYKLENAQQIANLGYWLYDKSIQKIVWSKSVFKFLGLESLFTPPPCQEILKLIHESDLKNFIKQLENALMKGIGYELETRIKNSQDKYKWFHIIGHAIKLEKQGFYVTGTIMDIQKRKESEEEIASLHSQLMETARRAGMSDVAVSVVHNVGNVLNSANVSMGLLEEFVEKPHLNKLLSAIDMIKNHLSSINDFFTQDDRGKLIPEFLVATAEIIKKDYSSHVIELNNLNKFLTHIKEIVTMQQELSQISGLSETIFVPEVIDSALKMSLAEAFSLKNIDLIKKYNFSPFIVTDRAKLLQIIVNLIQNAKESLLAKPPNGKKFLILEIQENDATVTIKVEDNGLGISKENLINIFTFGFTTKPGGHGFGLHSSALYAKEMGGTLSVESGGLNLGATFTLILPKKIEKLE